MSAIVVAVLVVGALIAVAGIVVYLRATRQKPAPVDPIASTTGSNRTLTGTTSTGNRLAIHWDEALRRFVAYALDDAPRESLSQPTDPEHAPVFKAVAEILEKIEAKPEYIPRRPSLLPKLLSTVNDPQAALVEISRIIAQDPALTGNLLRIANSPMYRISSMPVESIDRAVTLVGVQGIRSIIATALLQPLMTSGAGTFSRFPELVWEHTLYSASASEQHAVNVEKSEPFVSQLIGLLYGLSAIVVFRIVRDQFAAHPHLSPTPGSIARLLETWVAPTAGRIAASWELPERLQYALESQTLAAELQMENALGRSLKFGRVAGSLIVLCRLGRLTEAEARTIALAGEGPRRDTERVWDRHVAPSLRSVTASPSP
jgi:HD-like signal output (HDOD) protein